MNSEIVIEIIKKNTLNKDEGVGYTAVIASAVSSLARGNIVSIWFHKRDKPLPFLSILTVSLFESAKNSF